MAKAIFVKGSDIDFVPASHEDPKNPGALKKVLLSADVNLKGQLQMLNWAKMETGKSFERHYHQDMSEVFIIVKGSALMSAGTAGQFEEFSLSEGDAILIPPYCQHQMTNTGHSLLEYIVFGISEGRGGKTINVSDY